MGGQVEPPSGAGSRKRPIGVWIVLVWYAGSVLCSSLVFYLILGGVVAIPPAQKAYFDSLTTLDYIFIIVEAVVSLSAAITLFLLRKWAVNLFAAAFGVIVVTTIWNVVARGWLFAIVEVPGAVDVYARGGLPLSGGWPGNYGGSVAVRMEAHKGGHHPVGWRQDIGLRLIQNLVGTRVGRALSFLGRTAHRRRQGFPAPGLLDMEVMKYLCKGIPWCALDLGKSTRKPGRSRTNQWKLLQKI